MSVTAYQQWMDVGEKLGYTGIGLRDFVTSELNRERDERAQERQRLMDEQFKLTEIKRQSEREAQKRDIQAQKEAKEKERKAAREDNEKQRAHELQMKQLEVRDRRQDDPNASVRAKVPKLPQFNDKDDMDAYIERFERFAVA